MAKLFEYADLKNRNPRNGFDVSQHRFYTAKAGELLPCYVHEVIPGDKLEIDLQSFTRSRPVQTAAFTRIKENVEFFFVPFRLLWKHFPEFQKGFLDSDNQNRVVTDIKSMAFPMMPPTMLMQDVQKLLNACKQSFAAGSSSSQYQYSINEHGLPIFSTAEKLLNYLGYGRPISSATSSIDSTYPEDAPDTSVSSGTIPRNLRNVSLSPFPLLAYQKIYQDHFRVCEWEQYLPFTFNVDYLSGDMTNSNNYVLNLGSFHNSSGVLNAMPWMFRLRYVNYRKDMFMGLKPMDVASNVVAPLNGTHFDNSSSISPQKIRVQFTGTPNYMATVSSYAAHISNTNQSYTPYFDDKPWPNWRQYTDANVVGTSIFDIRRAEALAKYMDINQASKHTYKDFVFRHFGYSIPDGRAQLSERLGSFDGDIPINEVVNQNLSSDAAIIKGNGYGSMNGQKIHFEASEAGIVMGVYYIIPQLDYASTGIDPLNLKSDASDFFVPEFDRLGMQPSSMYTLSSNQDNASAINQLLGYAPSYVYYKTM